MESKKKKVSEEPRGRIGIKTQMWRVDFRIWRGERVGLDGVSESGMDMYTQPNVK